jgi:hypothetical protein
MSRATNAMASLLCGTLFAQQAYGLTIACRLDNDFPGSGTPAAPMAITLWSDVFVEYTDLTVYNDSNYHYGYFSGSPSCTTPCYPTTGAPWADINLIGPAGMHRALVLWSAATGIYAISSHTQNFYADPYSGSQPSGSQISCTRAGQVRLIPSGPRP